MSRNGRNQKSPAYQWYPSDAAIDGDYQALADDERGIFHRLLDFAWMNDGIPADVGEVARILQRRRALVDRWWPRLSRMFVSHSSKVDRLVNKRQERERASQAENRERRKAASVRANAVRWSESEHDRSPIGTESDSDSIPPVSLLPIPMPDKKKGASRAASPPPDLASLVAEFPSLDQGPTLTAMHAWADYRKLTKRPAWKPVTVRASLKSFVPHGAVALASAVELSKANGWQGLFPPKGAGGGAKQTTIETTIEAYG